MILPDYRLTAPDFDIDPESGQFEQIFAQVETSKKATSIDYKLAAVKCSSGVTWLTGGESYCIAQAR